VTIPDAALKRDKPVSLMGACGKFPEIPVGILQLQESAQAKEVLRRVEESASVYATCSSKQAGLVEWINNE